MVNETLRELRVEQHPDKTCIGRIERGFAFLGYWITKRGVTGVEPSAWQAFQGRVARLYEQNAPQGEILRRVKLYVRRWMRWLLGGVRVVVVGDAFRWPAAGGVHLVFASTSTQRSPLARAA
jgi:RNA-directed DNA polymerase